MNIYVSNLNSSTRRESFEELFAAYGEVASAKIITDRETGRSRGFGFVEMPNDEEGQAAINALNNTDFEGKTLSVSIARSREDRGKSGGYNRGGYNSGGYNGGGYNRNRY